MSSDPIIGEIRKTRDELAKRFNYDLHAIIEDARQQQAASGRKSVSRPPRPVRKESRGLADGISDEARTET